MLEKKINKQWKKEIEYIETEEFKRLSDFIKIEYKKQTIYPKLKNLFFALKLTPFKKVKVVVIGQDPYHNPNQANGLCFSVNKNENIPPSLKNIYKEIENDLKTKKNYKDGDLTIWAEQGVLLLNSILTVRKNLPGSHSNIGWEEFTNEIIKKLSKKHKNLIFLLWGNYAKQKKAIIEKNKHLILETTHPSPFSANSGFFGSKHFSKTNDYLKKNKKKPIIW